MNNIGNYLVQELIKEIENITDYVVVYSGRFQPFHKGHFATYQHLVKKFGKENVYIGTSDKTDKLKSPFNFKEKQTIMTKMFGIPSNKIVQIKNPYAPTEILKNFDGDTTAFITVVGEKDEQRLGGKYFTPYTGKFEAGYAEKGYVYISPAQPNAISGTDVRNWLGSGEMEDRKKLFSKAYPKFDEKIFNLITTKLSSLNESGAIDSGEPDVGYYADGTKRIINGAKPEIWFKQGGYTQLDKPKSDFMRGKGKNKDTESQFRKVTFQLKGVTQPAEKSKRVPYQVDKWKNVTPKNVKKKEARYWDLEETDEEKVKDTVVENGMGLAMGYPSKEQLAQMEKEREKLRAQMDSESEYYEPVEEDITIPINTGDTVLGGKFKNKRIVVKDIGKNEKGDITINNKPLLKFRLIDEIYAEIIDELRKDPQFEELLSEIPMDDLQQVDKFADKQMNPIDVVLTGKHFLERLVDKRNQKPISAAELTGFFKRLSRKKNEFVEFLKKYGEIVASDNRTKINIPFMQKANKAIAKTIMRKDDFKTSDPELKFEIISEDTIKHISKSLGVSRDKMPQINSKDVGEFIKYLKDKGIEASSSLIDVSKIGMTQKDINVDKVKDLLGVEKSNLAKPVIISKDNYILDGHHRVVALYNVDKNFKLKTIKIDLGIKDLLNVAREFPKASFKGITEFYGNYDTRHIVSAAPMKGLDEPDENWKDVSETNQTNIDKAIGEIEKLDGVEFWDSKNMILFVVDYKKYNKSAKKIPLILSKYNIKNPHLGTHSDSYMNVSNTEIEWGIRYI